jgi:hypothetical protein
MRHHLPDFFEDFQVRRLLADRSRESDRGGVALYSGDRITNK